MGAGTVETSVVALGRDDLLLIRGLRVIEETDEQELIPTPRSSP